MENGWPSVGRRLRNKLVAAVKTSLRVAGFQLSRLPEPDSVLATLNQRRRRFLDANHITLVLDVGANCGQFGAKLREQGYEGRIVSFEPLAGPFVDLERRIQDDSLWTAKRLALGESEGDSTINVSANTWSSSLLPIADRHVQAAPDSVYVAQEAVKIVRLDSVAPSIVGAADSIFLKLDVQGYEREVLRGARETLGQVVFAELELSLCTLYEGQASYHEVMEFLDDLGYDPVAIDNEFVEPGTGRVLQVNAIFERRCAC
jgi:FkbM family methyltransferase